MIGYESPILNRRPEYTLANMGRIFSVLHDFGIEISPQEQKIYDQLFCGIDFADQLVDNKNLFPQAPNHILSFLTGKQDFLPSEFPQPAVENFSFLREIVAEKGIGSQVEKSVMRLLLLRNRLTRVDSISEFIDLTREEAIESAKMAFLFLRQELPPHVKDYLTQANILGNLADNLLDLKSDYAQGQISLKPSQRLKVALKIEIFKLLATLSYHYPQKQELPGLVKKYITMLA